MTKPSIASVDCLDEMLSEPTEKAVEVLRQTTGDVLLLGVGGKMGPTLARMLVRGSQQAGTPRRVIGVSRFSAGSLAEQLGDWGVETIEGDLLEPGFLESLPDVPNVVYMTGMKFGTGGNAAMTWAMNTYLPTLVCRRYAQSRIVAFSSGNVYGLVSTQSKGSREEDLLSPIGEYAMSALGRERMFEYFSQAQETPTALVRLNYATELRYGVLVDLALAVYRGEPVDVSMGHVNVIWQGDANAMTICALGDVTSPAYVVNVSGPEILSTRAVCQRFGKLLDRKPNIVGNESDTALLNDGSRGHERYGLPRVSVEEMLPWIAEWVQSEKPLLGKPTHFESRSGKF